ncbi:alpha/beta hydrolase [Acinetobacter sp. WZC-1]|uniref:alpha/beta hydrolase n=1 Tax=Acinetobacter sp. WZC-1 TaxID=3459034 RepID=UPI00403DDC09
MANHNLEKVVEKGQGIVIRAVDRLPAFAQEAMVKALGYPYHYPRLDSFIKWLMAAQYKQGISGFIGPDIALSRQQFEAQAQSLIMKPTAVRQIRDIRLPLQSGTIAARHYHPAPGRKLPMLVYYHGGGFVTGSINSYDEVCRMLAVHARVQVLSIEYPLAPEVSPQQLMQSCEDALAWVFQNSRNFKILKNRVAISGDSAGGNISAVLAQRTVNATYAPDVQLLLYPTTDFKSRHPSFYAYKDGLVLTGTDIDYVLSYYADRYHVAHDDPILSPTYGHLHKLPPAYIVTAGHDVLHDEGEIYAHKLRQQGIRVIYRNVEDQTHGFFNFAPISRRTKKHVIEICRDFRKFWDKSY